METFAADLRESVENLDARDPSDRPPSPTNDDESDKQPDLNTSQDTRSGADDELLLRSSSLRVRLEKLSGLRIHTDAITFTSSEPSRCGGKAEVVKATLKIGDDSESDEQQVAVKKLRYSDDINGRKLGNIQDTFAGIEYLHTHQPPICHGDLKSLNILVSASYRAVITDFGSARILKEAEDRQEGRDIVPVATGASAISPATDERIDTTRITIVASSNQLTLTGPAWSLRWAAPEVALGEPQSLASDVWAAGWICWEVMTNKVPFPELNSEGTIVLKVVEGQVPAAHEDTQLSQVIRLCSLMTDCWAFDPRSRPNISRCHTEVGWMPSVRPSGRKTPGTSVPSAKLLLQMGFIRTDQARFREANTLFEQALSTATSTGDQASIAAALIELGVVCQHMAKYAEAEEHLTRAQDIFTGIGDELGQADALQMIGRTYYSQSKFAEAERSYTEARNIFARHGHAQGQAMTLRALGNILYQRSQYSKAEEFYNEAIDICARIGNDMGHADTLLRLGQLFSTQSQYTKAEKSFQKALEKYSRIGHNLGRADVISELAEVYRMQGLSTKAAPLYAQAREIYVQFGDPERAATCSHWLDVLSKEGDLSVTSPSVPGNDDVPSPTD